MSVREHRWEADLSREVNGRSESTSFWVDNEADLHRRIKIARETGWGVDGAWHVIMAKGHEGRQYESGREAIPLMNDGRRVAPRTGREIAWGACVKELMRSKGMNRDAAQARATEMVGAWLPGEQPREPVEPVVGVQPRLPYKDDEEIL